jgi:hypothetical protein
VNEREFCKEKMIMQTSSECFKHKNIGNRGQMTPVWISLIIFAAGITFGQIPAANAALVSRNIGVTLSASNLDSYDLDVDQNGTTDFTFQAAYVPDPTLTVGFDQITFLFGSNNAAVIDTQTGDGFPPASLLVPGNTISSASLFSSPIDTADLISDDTIDPITGNFNGQTGYVGFRFDGAGGEHYGYAQVSVNSLADPTNPLDLTLGTVVYNDVAGAPVTVPEPAGLGAGAALVLGLSTLLRRKTAARAFC